MPSLRDFVYLDWERVRSYIAQLDRGVPETLTGTLSSDEGDSLSGSGGVPGFLKLEQQQDLRVFRSASETRSLHHAVFSMFEERLAGSGLLVLDESFVDSEWSEETFERTTFVKVTGTVRLVDHAAILNLLEGFEVLMKIGHASELADLAKQGLPSAELQRRKQQLEKSHREQLKNLNVTNFSQLADGIRSLFGDDSIRVKIVPDIARSERMFVGTGFRESFDESVLRSIGARGKATSIGLTALIQVLAPMDELLASLPLPTGNTIEDSLDQIVTGMDELNRTVSGAEWPAVSCIPIALYRELGESEEGS